MKQKTKIIISAILVITWMAVIFCFSAVPADESNKQSLEIVNKAIEKFDAKSSQNINDEQRIHISQEDNQNKNNNINQQTQNNNAEHKTQNLAETTTNKSQTTQKTAQKRSLILELNRLLRKFAHASVYFILYILVLNLIYQIKEEYKFAYCMMSIAVCFLYACTDEFHQLFVDGRTGLFSDVIIDTIGATISFVIVEIIHRIITIIHQKNKKQREKIDTKR